MNKGGVIFDFNGTLFWDSPYQEISWDAYLAKHNVYLSDQEKRDYIHGRNGKDTFEYLFRRTLSNEEVEKFTEEKEKIYREECLKHTMELAPGAESLLSYLISHNIPIAIATASGKSNVDFFIEKLDLLRYFNKNHIIYNDGTVKGKPDPDIFQKAIKALGADAKKTIIFEDSFSGIKAALACNVSEVIIVNSTNSNYTQYNLPCISHFDDFDRSILIK